ncbi:hypothetical protein JAAARDRAFT_120214 [Jaapia argillacea MUCL 33604]|uniref:ACB domain-containing protein n=1 Tax=Jaapia argillacea MUCL 33604 TaxID=933084 RepID=A0A067Q8Y2_9AGAM|nr:hypothetical protein JAAARDRAFT_120214 [Jaapia argillacea MUCL 33604]
MSSEYTPSLAFHNAAAYLSNASSLSKVSNDTKLELYGLFKCLTVSSSPNSSRPSIFDFTGRAKWDAWSSAGKTFGNRLVDAEARYLEIAASLGWRDQPIATPPSLGKKGEEEEEIDWDDESPPQNRGTGAGGGGGGMGATVSSVAPPPLGEDADTVHGIALSGDVAELKGFLDAHPEVDLNERDEFGYTPLHLACDRGNTIMVQELLRKGVDQNVKDADEFTAIELARVAGHEDIVAILEKPDS